MTLPRRNNAVVEQEKARQAVREAADRPLKLAAVGRMFEADAAHAGAAPAPAPAVAFFHHPEHKAAQDENHDVIMQEADVDMLPVEGQDGEDPQPQNQNPAQGQNPAAFGR